MNVELKRIAEKKIEQLGGDVCGVLVRKDGKLAAMDEHGRVQWLQDGQGAEPVVDIGTQEREGFWQQPIDKYTQPAQQGSVPEGWGYVVEVFLENVEEVTELLLSGGAADNIVALCNDLNKAATVAEKVLSTPQPEGDWCEWHGDDNGTWMSACGKEWYFEDGGPEDNGMNYCVKCGKRCIEIGSSDDGGESHDSAM